MTDPNDVATSIPPSTEGFRLGEVDASVRAIAEEFRPDDVNAFNRRIIEEFRANRGQVGGMFAGAPLLLLTHTGARSGRRRIAPLAYGRDGDRLVVIASKGGAPTNPDWYHNLVANPEVTVELPGETFAAHANVAEGTERDRLYDQMTAQMPNFAEYQRNTERRIPVVLLERVADARP